MWQELAQQLVEHGFLDRSWIDTDGEIILRWSDGENFSYANEGEAIAALTAVMKGIETALWLEGAIEATSWLENDGGRFNRP